MKPINLLCEYSNNPLGLMEKKPRFTWEVSSEGEGKFQTAYQILVASSADNLENDEGDIWNSGKVDSEQSTNNVYQGVSLEGGKEYFWKVRIWDETDNPGMYSKIATFEMGLLDAEDWEGYWITYNDDIKGPLFRKEFSINKDVKRARAYVTGLGYYELRINGEKVGDEVLDPGWTDYDKRILYVTKDITDNLNKGENAVGIMAGNGRYSPAIEVIEKNPNALKSYHDKPVVLIQINIEFNDGSCMSVYTDDSWQVNAGPIIFNDIYDGEVYDARLEKEGWDNVDFDGSQWLSAVKANPQPSGKLVSQTTCPPVKVCKTLYPQKITSPEPGVYVYDFGQNFTGWIKLKGTGNRGDKVQIRYAELLDDKGKLNTVPNRGADATDVYIFKGEGEEVYEPRFTYHGFRYVEVSGFPGTPFLDNIEGKVVHTAVTKTGNFFCSNDLINNIHSNILWGQVSNLMSIPTDCPQRDERMGWMGDAQLVAEESVYNFDMVGFYQKWLADIRDAQREDGSVPDVVPPYWPLYPADPAWATACVVIPWYIYQFYNDRRILTRNYEMMKKYVNFLKSQAEDNIIQDLGKYGDWCPPWHVNSVDTPLELVSTWYYYHDTLTVSRAARVLGYDSEAEEFAQRAFEIKESFNERFLQGDRYMHLQDEWYERMVPETLPRAEKESIKKGLSQTFGVDSQTSNILPLYLEMVPQNKKEKIMDTLIHDIEVIHNLHLNTGIVGTRYMMDVLSRNGYAELAYKIVTQTTYPGWGYMIKEGATTLWERWEYLADVGMNSHNHIMLGTVDTWFYKYLAGINLDLSAPGFEIIVIKPVPVTGLEQVSASLDTIRGIISSNWSKDDESFNLKVKIPGNTKAKVFLPRLSKNVVIEEKGELIWENGLFQGKGGEIIAVTEEDDYIMVTVNPGSYEFEVKSVENYVK